MRTLARLSATAVVLLAAPLADNASAFAQDSAAAGGGARAAELPLRPTRNARFTTDEGTWLSVDVAPDGRTIVTDIAGDLYTLPITGGKATRITEGMAFDAQPRWSPDGKKIVFVSDRDGSDDVWTVDADGKNPKQVTRSDRAMWVSPEWTPDGRYIVVSRNTALFATTYSLWMFHRDGGTGLRVTAAPPPPPAPGSNTPVPPVRNYVGAAFGKDGRYIYASSRMGGAAGYNQTGFDWAIVTYDRETGETSTRAAAGGGAFKPVLSPDGKWMVYATRADSVTSLRLRDMDSGDEQWLARNVQRDDMESRFTRDLMPHMSFTPDSRALVAAWDGRIRRVEIPGGRVTEIPFTADIDVPMGPLAKFDYPRDDSTITVGQIRGARPSPDGRRLAFTALDKLWTLDLAGCPATGCTARRLTRSPHEVGEHMPVWSPDGRYIAYVSWTETGGDIYRIPATGGAAERLTRQQAFYTDPSYTPNGQRIVAYRAPRQPRIEETPMYGRELVWIPAAGGNVTSIAPLGGGGYPHFRSNDNERVYVAQGPAGLVSMRFDGTDRKTHLRVTGNPDHRSPAATPSNASEILISPDGERAVAEVDNNIYVLEIPMVGAQAPAISVTNPAQAAIPVRRLTRIGGDFSGWHADGQKVHFSIGRSYFTYDLPRADSLIRDSTARADSVRRARAAGAGADSASRVAQGVAGVAGAAGAAGAGGAGGAAGAPRDTTRPTPAYEPARLDVAITVPKDKPRGSVVLRNARVITMNGNEVIERADILVRDNRIAAVAPSGTLQIPQGAQQMDMTGKTIVPGFVDTHAHMWPDWGIHRAQPWIYLANLAYGVTTTRDPQTATTDVLSYGDLVETGDILGPRIFSTGPGVFWSDNISSLNDARDVLKRYTDYYNTQTIKQYMVGDRKVRQWVIMASRELGLTPTLEGGLDYKKNLTEAMDGYAGTEHSYPIAPLFRDNVQLIAESGITYTPTLLVLYGGPWAENFWFQRHDITRDAKLARFTPRRELLRMGLRRPGWWHESQYSHPLIAAQANKIMQAGGRVGIGSHGQLQGLGYHWEMWTLASGGTKPMDVLRAATIMGADAIGHGKNLGSIAAGKLADLVVLDANPLENIMNTNTVRFVMKNGRLYDGNTLAEVYPRRRELARGWWSEGVSSGRE